MKKHFFKLLKRYRQLIQIALIAGITILVFIPVFTYIYFARDLTTKEGIMNRNDTGVILTDRHDRPFFSFYQARKKNIIPLEEIPEHTRQAAIASEDKEFYQHPGFSIRGILRSAFLDIRDKGVSYGGSTITQQLVKNALLHSRRSFLRKYQEIVLASEIERRYSKNEILEMYLNSVYFGEGAFGIEQAALAYFGKDAKDLTLAESALLIGILPSPSNFSPLSGNPQKAEARQKLVLESMQQEGYITLEAKDEALNIDLPFNPKRDDFNSQAPHFALMVRDALIEKFGEERISRSGFIVKTTIDLDKQQYAESIVSTQVARLAGNRVTNGAAVALDPKTGEILAWVGSKDWYDDEFGKVDIITSLRPPGSSFKPIVFAAALEDEVITPATVLQDRPTTFAGDYRPENYDRRFRGPVLARRALANSLNVPAVEVLDQIGVPRALEMAKRMGITTLKDPSQYGLALVLGTGEVKLLEMTNAYAAFANNGYWQEATGILQITDKREEVIFQHTPDPRRVMDPEVAFLISSILSDNTARQEVFGSALTIPRVAAVKTGTTENYRDAWTIGYTPSLAVGVWVGNNDNSTMDQVAGSLGAAPIWRSIMTNFLEGTPNERFVSPEGIVAVGICSYNGLLVRGATSSAQTEYFIRGTEPSGYCFYQRPTQPQQPTGSPAPTQEISPTPTMMPTEQPQQPSPTESEEERKKKEKDIQQLLSPVP